MSDPKTGAANPRTDISDGGQTAVEEAAVEESKPTPWLKLKVVLGIVAFNVVIALILPITPNKTGKPKPWPNSWSEYFDEFVFSLLLANGLTIVLAIGIWVYWKWSKTSDELGDRTDH